MQWIPGLAVLLSASGSKGRRQSQNVGELSVCCPPASVGDQFLKQLLLMD